jgi:hypothetical protein
VPRELGSEGWSRGRETRRHERDAEDHLLTVRDQDMAGGMQGGEDRDKLEAAAEERVRRVGDLDLLGLFVGWILEGGIKLMARLTQ